MENKEIVEERNITELVFILDRSGSMHGLEKDTIGGFNSLVEKQKKEEGECLVTTVLFSNESETLHDRVPLGEISELSEKDYMTGGCTALIDSIGETIAHIGKIHRYIRKEDRPRRTLFVITTDGMENASHVHRADEVRKAVEKKKKEGWEFLFIGANIDSFLTARKYGIDTDMAVNYVADDAGTATVFSAVEKVVGKVRKNRKISACWSDEISDDYKSRKKQYFFGSGLPLPFEMTVLSVRLSGIQK